MDPRRRFSPSKRNDPDAEARRKARRLVMNDVRRIVERQARVADAAEGLAAAAQDVLVAAAAMKLDLDRAALAALDAALARYREASGD